MPIVVPLEMTRFWMSTTRPTKDWGARPQKIWWFFVVNVTHADTISRLENNSLFQKPLGKSDKYNFNGVSASKDTRRKPKATVTVETPTGEISNVPQGTTPDKAENGGVRESTALTRTGKRKDESSRL